MQTESELLSQTQILSDVTGAPQTKLSAHSTPQNTPGWDSLANLTFIASVEQELDVSISTVEILRMRSLQDLVAYLLRVLAEAPKFRTGAPEGV